MRGKPVTLVGIGDMSGDVFGNGLMLLGQPQVDRRLRPSPHLHRSGSRPGGQLRGTQAPVRASASRNWSDYNPALISQGGGVFTAASRRIELSPRNPRRARHRCRGARQREPDSGDSARADVEMLYNGGIGTYVRASNETDAEVGDHTNDAAGSRRKSCARKIVVEGGNLGFTQQRAHRVRAQRRNDQHRRDRQFGRRRHVGSRGQSQDSARAGARARRAVISRAQRALAASTDEVAERVLRDNRDQVLPLSLEQMRSPHRCQANSATT